MLDRIKNEPVVLVNLVFAIIAAVVAFGVSLSEEQKIAIVGVVAALLTILTRQLVTPTRTLPEKK